MKKENTTMSHVLSSQLASRSAGASQPRRWIMTTALWIVQGLLALLFLFAGSMKLILPVEMMTAQMPLPGLFLRFIGVAEVAGALGLILPGLLFFTLFAPAILSLLSDRLGYPTFFRNAR